jgi:hypothetical protein
MRWAITYTQLKIVMLMGTKFVVAKNDEAKQRASKKNFFTCLGLKLLSGEPLMCVVIVYGKTDDSFTKFGVDVVCDIFNPNLEPGEDQYDHLLNNIGSGHQYLGGPSCSYKGKLYPTW